MKFSIIILIYALVLIRNISFKDEILYYYELPNFVTALLLLTLNIVYFKREDIARIMDYIFIYSFILAILGLFKYIKNPSVRLSVFGGPNGYYKIALLFQVLCFHDYYEKEMRKYLVGIVLGLVLCIATGSKGGIFTMLVILIVEIVFFIFNAGEKRVYLCNKVLKLLMICVAGYFIIGLVLKRIPALYNMLSRASVILNHSQNLSSLTSISERLDLYELGIQAFKEAPVFGKGARYTFFYTNGEQPYSHNIFIEFLSENGLVISFPLIIFIMSVFLNAIKYGVRDVNLFCLFLCLIVYFSGSLFSGNILDSKIIFVFGILMFNYVYNKKINEQENS